MALEKPMDTEAGWSAINAPELHKWDKPGEMIFGKLLSFDRILIDNKPVIQLMLRIGKDRRLKTLAPYDLTQKITRAHIGMLLRIKYLGEDEKVKKNGNAMKVFDVQVKADPDAGSDRDSGPITDEDIPF